MFRLSEWFKLSPLFLAAAITVCVLTLIFIMILSEIQDLASLPAFFTFNGQWFPTEGLFDLTPMLLSTLLIAVCALAFSIPISIVQAYWLIFIAKKNGVWSILVKRFIEVFSGFPSVVFGLWGLTEIVPLIAKWTSPGFGLLASAVVLAAMISPYLTLLFEANFLSAPTQLKLVSNSLGITHQKFLFQILIPYSIKRLVQSSALALGRGIGETMAIVMVAGNVVNFPTDFIKPIRTITGAIALEMGYAVDGHRSALFMAGFILLVFSLLIALLTQDKMEQYDAS